MPKPLTPRNNTTYSGMAFETYHCGGQYWIPTYTQWLLHQDVHDAYRYHRRILQLLHSRCPPYRWHLKTPVHMLAPDALLDTYPDALFMFTHRDPAAVLAWVCALIQETRRMASDHYDPRAIGREQLELWLLAIERAVGFRTKVDEERFADVFFHEQLADPVGAVRKAYAKLGIHWTEEAQRRMQACSDARP